MNEHSKALKYCIGAIRLDPNSSKANHLMGNILQNLGRAEQAEKFFLRADNIAKEIASREQTEVNNISISLEDVLESKIRFRDMKAGDSRVLDIDQVSYSISCLSTRPFIILLDNFLNENECRHIIAAARPSLTESFLIGGGGREGTEEDAGDAYAYRSSFNAWLPQDDILTGIKKRLSQLTGIPMRYLVQKCEDLQVVRYEEGGQFKVHHDSSNFQKRFITALLYLNTPTSIPSAEGVEAGGETWFPFGDSSGEGITSTEEAIGVALGEYSSSLSLSTDCDSDSSNAHKEGAAAAVGRRPRRGIRISPRRGRMALFFNHHLDGAIDPLAVHAGLPVRGTTAQDSSCSRDNATAGMTAEKWVSNYWIDLDEDFLIQCLQ